MFNFQELDKYKETNQIEAKSALGGLPDSIWETYSAFANTLGGRILLGVKEGSDRSLYAVDLPDPEGLIEEFWYNVRNPNVVSVNLLKERDVYIQEAEGKRIVVIDVPPAKIEDKPVFINGNPLYSYCRDGDGDFLLTKEQVYKMIAERFKNEF